MHCFTMRDLFQELAYSEVGAWIQPILVEKLIVLQLKLPILGLKDRFYDFLLVASLQGDTLNTKS